MGAHCHYCLFGLEQNKQTPEYMYIGMIEKSLNFWADVQVVWPLECPKFSPTPIVGQKMSGSDLQSDPISHWSHFGRSDSQTSKYHQFFVDHCI